MDSAEFISKYGLFSKAIMIMLLYIMAKYAQWGLETDRPGADIAMILGAVYTPMIGLFKYVFEFADRKNNNSTPSNNSNPT